MKIVGINQVNGFLDNYINKVNSAVSDGLKEGGEKILSESKSIAPKKSGEMIRQTDVLKVSDKQYQVRYNTDYSLYVHEDMETRHSSGRAKFLQEATDKFGKEVIANINKKVSNVKR